MKSKRRKESTKAKDSEFLIIDSGKFKGDYLNTEGRRYTKVQLQERRPELFLTKED